MNIGGVISALSGPPGVNVVSKVKSKPLQGVLNTALTDYKGLRDSGQKALGDYIAQYMSHAGDVKNFGAQEEGSVSDFFNGNLSNRLSQLRASRSQAVNSAADVGVNQAVRAANGNDLANEGGGSSYQTRQMMGAVAPIRTAAAVDNSNQERADLGFVTEGQMSNLGKRDDIINRTASYSSLVPEQARRSMYGQDMGFLGNLLQADQMNHFYGLKQDSNMAADFFNATDQGIMETASLASSLSSTAGAAGGMKDGGLVRRNYVKGGKVNGPGTGTSDSIPVKVSDGEFIMPAKAVKMPGVLPLLEHIRQMALKDSTTINKKGGADGRHFFDGGDLSFGSGSLPTGDGMDFGGGPQQQQQQQQAKPKSSGGGGGGGSLGPIIADLEARQQHSLFAQWFPSSSTFGDQSASDFEAPGAFGGASRMTDQQLQQSQGVYA